MANPKPKSVTSRTHYDRIWDDVAEIAADLANVAITDIEHQYKKQRARDVYLELRAVLKKLGL